MGAGIEELVFVGWLAPLLAVVGLLVVRRRQRGLAWLLALAAVVPALLALGANLPGYEQLWKALPPLHATRVPERFLPIACLALAALVAFALDRLRRPGWVAVALVVLVLDLHVAVFGAVEPDESSRAYARSRRRPSARATGDPARHPLRERLPRLCAAVAARAAAGLRDDGAASGRPLGARHRGLSCGRGRVPPYIRFVAVHRGVYRQSGFFAAACPERAEASLRAQGFRLAARDGAISTWARRRLRHRAVAGLVRSGAYVNEAMRHARHAERRAPSATAI